MQRQAWIFALATGVLIATPATASTIISGSFDFNGSLIAGLNSTTWLSDAAVPDQATIENNSDLSGSFTGLGNTTIGIEDLDRATEPVGTLFTPQDFINFLAPAASSFPQLDINFIALGDGGAAGCTAPPAAGQTCTPNVPGGSPFTFTNSAVKLGAVTFIESSMTMGVSGVSSDGMETWAAIITSQFTEPFQSVLAQLATTGSFSNSYSDSSIVFTTSTVPEPDSLAFLAFGLLLVVSAGRVHRRRRHTDQSAQV